MNIIRATHQLATEMSALARYSLAKGFKENAPYIPKSSSTRRTRQKLNLFSLQCTNALIILFLH